MIYVSCTSEVYFDASEVSWTLMSVAAVVWSLSDGKDGSPLTFWLLALPLVPITLPCCCCLFTGQLLLQQQQKARWDPWPMVTCLHPYPGRVKWSLSCLAALPSQGSSCQKEQKPNSVTVGQDISWKEGSDQEALVSCKQDLGLWNNSAVGIALPRVLVPRHLSSAVYDYNGL